MEKGFGYIAELGKVVIPYGIEISKVFADPDKGFFISLAGYYALSVATVRAEDVANHIEEWAKAIENWDPVGAYESWVRSVTGLGNRPIYHLFNPMVAWEEVSAIEALREAPCGWLDWGCYLSNAAKWVLKGILTPVFFIKNLLLGVAYYVIAGAVQVGKFIAVGFLRYVLKPVAYAVAWVIDRIRESLKTVFCYYLKLAQAGTVVKEVAFGKGSLGRRILKGVAKLVGFYVLTSIVAKECVLVTVGVSPIVSPPTVVGIVQAPTLTPYAGSARVHVDSLEVVSASVITVVSARISLRSEEYASVAIGKGSATLVLGATESARAVLALGSATLYVDSSESAAAVLAVGYATLVVSADELVEAGRYLYSGYATLYNTVDESIYTRVYPVGVYSATATTTIGANESVYTAR